MKAIKFPAAGGYSLIDVPEKHNWRWFPEQIGSEYMEIVHPKKLHEPYLMIVDEEGLLNEKPVNHFGSWLYGTEEHGNPIVGDILIMKEEPTPDGNDIVGMTEEEVYKLLADVVKFAD